MAEFRKEPERFLKMVNDDANRWLPQLFQLAAKKKKFRIHWKIVSHGYWPWLDDYIEDNLPAIWAIIEQYEHDRI